MVERSQEPTHRGRPPPCIITHFTKKNLERWRGRTDTHGRHTYASPSCHTQYHPPSTLLHGKAAAASTRHGLWEPPKLPDHKRPRAKAAEREQPREPLNGAEDAARPRREALARLDLGDDAPHHNRCDGEVADALHRANEAPRARRQPAAGGQERVLAHRDGREGEEGGDNGGFAGRGEGGRGILVTRGRGGHPRRPPGGGGGGGGRAAAAEPGPARGVQAANGGGRQRESSQERDRHDCAAQGRTTLRMWGEGMERTQRVRHAVRTVFAKRRLR
ncbi:hypothetical protein BU14_0339s0013 [Porphyra umbilicalis]|uniref:Uncharacterized protein n=1 Tax=Porphyra umbilicalis TaxID=2786 RepID=A0A1X6NY45_PORUM|nr:hypothetical protein BU14_0339s0013 [Porphyra umbilicalis]|eukprot:OSX73549.1 hypothetical protein BU14_0339s0013 [Porphyra umbilicalis]